MRAIVMILGADTRRIISHVHGTVRGGAGREIARGVWGAGARTARRAVAGSASEFPLYYSFTSSPPKASAAACCAPHSTTLGKGQEGGGLVRPRTLRREATHTPRLVDVPWPFRELRGRHQPKCERGARPGGWDPGRGVLARSPSPAQRAARACAAGAGRPGSSLRVGTCAQILGFPKFSCRCHIFRGVLPLTPHSAPQSPTLTKITGRGKCGSAANPTVERAQRPEAWCGGSP